MHFCVETSKEVCVCVRERKRSREKNIYGEKGSENPVTALATHQTWANPSLCVCAHVCERLFRGASRRGVSPTQRRHALLREPELLSPAGPIFPCHVSRPLFPEAL